MPSLTRRRSDNPHQENWHVYYGDVQVGRIGERAGVPVDVDQWRWSCGFYPGTEPSDYEYGIAANFFTARREFEIAWRVRIMGTRRETTPAQLDDAMRLRRLLR